MSDRFKEQISEFIDDEMSVEQGEFFVRRLGRDQEARLQYLRYQLIGAAIRGEYRFPGDVGFPGSLCKAIDEAGGAGASPGPGTRRLVAGVGIAACIAIAVTVVLTFSPAGPGRRTVVAGPAAVAAAPAEAGMLASPGGSESRSLAAMPGNVTGIQYLINHVQYTSGMNRTIVHSNFVAGQDAILATFIEADETD